MVEGPRFGPPGEDPGAAAVHPVKPAIPVDGKLRCPDHPHAKVRVVVGRRALSMPGRRRPEPAGARQWLNRAPPARQLLRVSRGDLQT